MKRQLLKSNDFVSSVGEVGDLSFELESLHCCDSEQEIDEADLDCQQTNQNL